MFVWIFRQRNESSISHQRNEKTYSKLKMIKKHYKRIRRTDRLFKICWMGNFFPIKIPLPASFFNWKDNQYNFHNMFVIKIPTFIIPTIVNYWLEIDPTHRVLPRDLSSSSLIPPKWIIASNVQYLEIIWTNDRLWGEGLLFISSDNVI